MALPDGAFVVRGGVAVPRQLQLGVAEHEAVPGLVGFSVQSAAARSVDELALAGRIPNRQISVTTVGAIRSVGLDVVVSPGVGLHATVMAPDPLPVSLAEALSREFVARANRHRLRRP